MGGGSNVQMKRKNEIYKKRLPAPHCAYPAFKMKQVSGNISVYLRITQPVNPSVSREIMRCGRARKSTQCKLGYHGNLFNPPPPPAKPLPSSLILPLAIPRQILPQI